jgi:hypothetical protein
MEITLMPLLPFGPDHPNGARRRKAYCAKTSPASFETVFVMAGLVPAIHVFPACGAKDVDAPDKPGHDEEWCEMP